MRDGDIIYSSIITSPDHQSPFFSFLVLVLFLLVRVTGHRNFKKTLENITERGEKRRRGKSTSAP